MPKAMKKHKNIQSKAYEKELFCMYQGEKYRVVTVIVTHRTNEEVFIISNGKCTLQVTKSVITFIETQRPIYLP